MISRELVQKAKHMREITGFGLHECRDLLLEFGNMEDALVYLRKNSDEPQYEGLTKDRFDVLDAATGSVLFSTDTEKELRQGGYLRSGKYTIRYVDCVGRYSEFRVK